jgi:hypothetical protein
MGVMDCVQVLQIFWPTLALDVVTYVSSCRECHGIERPGPLPATLTLTCTVCASIAKGTPPSPSPPSPLRYLNPPPLPLLFQTLQMPAFFSRRPPPNPPLCLPPPPASPPSHPPTPLSNEPP